MDPAQTKLSPLVGDSIGVSTREASAPGTAARADVADAISLAHDQLRTIIDTIPSLAWSARADGSIEFCNQRWLDYTGLSAQEALGWGWVVVIHPDDRPALTDYWVSIVSSGAPGETQARMRSATGEYRSFLIRSSALRDASGNIVRWYGTNTDIEDLTRAQDVLRASEQNARLIIDSIPGLVYTMTADGQVDQFNRPLLEYFGRTAEELKAWQSADVIHPEDLPRVHATWERSYAAGSPLYEVDQRLRGVDGRYRWFRLRALSVRGADDRVVRWYGLLTDMHEQKRAERRLRRAIKARYEAALAERNRIAREMHDGLLQDISALDLQLGALLPHVGDVPEIARRLEPILELVARANRAARQALIGMRGLSGSADLVSAVHGEAQRLTTPALLPLSMTVSGPVVPVAVNVCDVALSFIHEAITNVIRHAHARSVKVSVVFASRRLRLIVRDDGRGMTIASESQSAPSHFGLVGIRERATSVGGALRVSSAPDHGTALRLDVPLFKQSASAHHP